MTGKVWHAYLKKGGNNTYVGLISGKEEHAIKYPNESFEVVLKRLNRNFKHLRTNLDKDKTDFDEWILKACRKLAEEKYNEDFCIISKGRGAR